MPASKFNFESNGIGELLREDQLAAYAESPRRGPVDGMAAHPDGCARCGRRDDLGDAVASLMPDALSVL